MVNSTIGMVNPLIGEREQATLARGGQAPESSDAGWSSVPSAPTLVSFIAVARASSQAPGTVRAPSAWTPLPRLAAALKEEDPLIVTPSVSVFCP
jgi:hypothetical protein